MSLYRRAALTKEAVLREREEKLRIHKEIAEKYEVELYSWTSVSISY